MTHKEGKTQREGAGRDGRVCDYPSPVETPDPYESLHNTTPTYSQARPLSSSPWATRVGPVHPPPDTRPGPPTQNLYTLLTK